MYIRSYHREIGAFDVDKMAKSLLVSKASHEREVELAQQAARALELTHYVARRVGDVTSAIEQAQRGLWTVAPNVVQQIGVAQVTAIDRERWTSTREPRRHRRAHQAAQHRPKRQKKVR